MVAWGGFGGGEGLRVQSKSRHSRDTAAMGTASERLVRFRTAYP